MSENANQYLFRSLPYLGGLVVILFVTSYLPALYFYSNSEYTTYSLAVRSLLIAVTPVLFLPIIYWVSIKKPILEHWKNILLHIALSILFGFGFLFIYQLMALFFLGGENFFSLNLGTMAEILLRQFLAVGSMLFFSYWGIVVLFGLKKYYDDIGEVQRTANEIQVRLEHATLSSLQAQLKPHFLFNTLSMVDQMITEHPVKASELVDKLERLLRSTFDRNNSESCTLDEEVDFLKKYLTIEESRFYDRLDVKYDILSETKEILVPRYLLQPLVENALIHGVSKSIKKCSILIKSGFENENLVLTVENDDFNKRKRKPGKTKGVGLSNVEERIALYYGKDAELNVDCSNSGKFISRIIIPKCYIKIRSGDHQVELPAS